MEHQAAAPRPKENLLLGTLGAILFSLVGGVVYYVLWSINIIAALSGIICVLCAIKGYEIFSRRSTKRGIAISVAVSAVVLILAWYVCFCTDLQAYFQALYEAGEAETVPSLGLCLRYGVLELPANPGYLVDLVLSLAMAALGCWGYVTRALRMQEARETRMAEQNRTMELARIQAEQAARAAEAEAAAENTGEESDGTAREEADT
jgi:hypothetical protein